MLSAAASASISSFPLSERRGDGGGEAKFVLLRLAHHVPVDPR